MYGCVSNFHTDNRNDYYSLYPWKQRKRSSETTKNQKRVENSYYNLSKYFEESYEYNKQKSFGAIPELFYYRNECIPFPILMHLILNVNEWKGIIKNDKRWGLSFFG